MCSIVAIILHSQQQYMSIPVALHPYQHLILSVFSILATVHTENK